MQNLVGIIITVWSHNHHSISFWEISKSFTIQPLATSGCIFKTSFSNSCKQFLCIMSIISDAKKTGQFEFAENPKSRKMEAPFENKPQWEGGLVSLRLISKGRVTHLCNHVCVIDITLVRVKLQQQSTVNCRLGQVTGILCWAAAEGIKNSSYWSGLNTVGKKSMMDLNSVLLKNPKSNLTRHDMFICTLNKYSARFWGLHANVLCSNLLTDIKIWQPSLKSLHFVQLVLYLFYFILITPDFYTRSIISLSILV